MPTTAARRELLQLAHKYDPAKSKVANYYISDKLDGTRCFWDGGVSRGVPTDKVPWASVLDPKTGKRKAKIKPVATGLYSRYGNPIIAPDWFLNQLPACPLDGELFAGVGNFQLCRSICGGDTPDPRFDQIQYAVYSSPPLPAVFASGLIKNSNMICEIDLAATQAWVEKRLEDFDGDFRSVDPDANFNEELLFLAEVLGPPNDAVYMLQQTRLPGNEMEAKAFVEEYLNKVLERGGEGVVLRDPLAIWTPKRNKGILKFKDVNDAEGTLVGFTSGRETLKGSKHLGRVGALILDFAGKRLELSGLTDDEREFSTPEAVTYATNNPGEDMPAWCERSKHFTVGETISFKYRELSDAGVPKEGRFFRKRDEE